MHSLAAKRAGLKEIVHATVAFKQRCQERVRHGFEYTTKMRGQICSVSQGARQAEGL